MTQKNFKSFYSALTIILIISIFVLAIVIVASQPKPLGSDVYFHLKLSTFYAHGDFGGAWNMMFHDNLFFYPMLFHLMLVPVALSSNPNLGLQIIECLFIPLTFLTVCWLIWKYNGAKAALFTGFALIASWSFIDGALQARPESIDMLLFPIIIYAVMETKKKTAGITSTIMVWSHGFASASSLFGVFIYKLFDKKWRKTLLFIVLAVSPVIILSVIFFEGAIRMWLLGQTQSSNPQNWMFWNNPFPWIIYYGGLSLWGIPFLLRRHKTQLEFLLTCAFVGNTFMLVFWADRWLHYSAIPWACLYGIGISRLHGWKLAIIIAVSIGYVALYFSIYFLTSANHLWWQPGD
jgi:hypothetical protein